MKSGESSFGTGRTTAPFALPSAPVVEADDGGVVGDRRAELERGRPGQRQGEAGVVGPGVEVEEAGHEVIGVERGEVGQRLAPCRPRGGAPRCASPPVRS